MRIIKIGPDSELPALINSTDGDIRIIYPQADASSILSAMSSTDVVRIRCIACDGSHCEDPYVCRNAVMCWKSRSQDSVGVERIKRGCIEKPEKIVLMCKTKRHVKANKQS